MAEAAEPRTPTGEAPAEGAPEKRERGEGAGEAAADADGADGGEPAEKRQKVDGAEGGPERGEEGEGEGGQKADREDGGLKNGEKASAKYGNGWFDVTIVSIRLRGHGQGQVGPRRLRGRPEQRQRALQQRPGGGRGSDAKEKPMEETTEEPKDEPKEESKEETKEESKEETKEESKEDVKEETKEEVNTEVTDGVAEKTKDEAADQTTPPGGLTAGVRAEAKYGNSFFDVTVVEIGESTIKVKWDHDQSESECPKDEVRLKDGAGTEDGEGGAAGHLWRTDGGREGGGQVRQQLLRSDRRRGRRHHRQGEVGPRRLRGRRAQGRGALQARRGPRARHRHRLGVRRLAAGERRQGEGEAGEADAWHRRRVPGGGPVRHRGGGLGQGEGQEDPDAC
ncbi:unnamed protein product [Prorocentrum cordatum]|uniref:Uncharacterized protein n=1 Tax=Prorocentrum cordatum TaxID=2364126 RepID=A0ABN9V4Q1_9DINO|nr:unnamed protein product [Polarella glacialis]